MGIRTDQPQGLSPEAELFLQENAKKSELKICSECKHQTGGELVKKKYDRYVGMFADMDGGEEGTYPLYRYELKDGGEAMEYEQCAPWSSGPVIFLGLRIVNQLGTRKIEWSDKEIEERM